MAADAGVQVPERSSSFFPQFSEPPEKQHRPIVLAMWGSNSLKSIQRQDIHWTMRTTILLLLGAFGSVAWMGLLVPSHDHAQNNHSWRIDQPAKSRRHHHHHHHSHKKSHTPDRYTCKIQCSYRILSDPPEKTPSPETTTRATPAGVVRLPPQTGKERDRAVELLRATYNQVHANDFEMQSTVLSELETQPTLASEAPTESIPWDQDHGVFRYQASGLRGHGIQGGPSTPSSQLSRLGALTSSSSSSTVGRLVRFHGRTAIVQRPQFRQDVPTLRFFSGSLKTMRETEWHRQWEEDWCLSLVQEGSVKSSTTGGIDLFFRSAQDCAIDLYDCVLVP